MGMKGATIRIIKTKTGKPVRFFKRDIKRNCGAETNGNNIFFAFLHSLTGGVKKQKGRVRTPGGRTSGRARSRTGTTMKRGKSGS